jgi:MSHA biogenesis protein MshK
VFKTYFNSLLSAGLFIVVTVTTSSLSLAFDVDPTQPFGVSNSGSNTQIKLEDDFVLSSIIHGDGIHTAVINGEIYKMLDYVGEYHITAINSHSVILRSESKLLKINIFNNKGFKSSVVEDMVAN